MTLTATFQRSAITAIRTTLIVTGVVALIAGLVILVWPGRTALVVTAVVATYAILTGLMHVISASTSRGLGRGMRALGIVLGAVYVIGGVLILANLAAAAVTLAAVLGIMVGILWIIDGIATFGSLRDSLSKPLDILFGVLSIIGGAALLCFPLFGVAVLWWVLGSALVALGVLRIVRSIVFSIRAPRAAG